MYTVCADHLDQALDEFLEVYGAAPDLFLLAALNCANWDAPDACDFCSRPPVYLVL